VLIIRLGRLVIVVGGVWLSSVVGLWVLMGSRGGVVISADEAAKVAGAYQFFNLIL